MLVENDVLYYSSTLSEEPYAEFGRMDLDGQQRQILAGKRFDAFSAVDGWLYGMELVAEWGHDQEYYDKGNGLQPLWCRTRIDDSLIQEISAYPQLTPLNIEKAVDEDIEKKSIAVLIAIVMAMLTAVAWFTNRYSGRSTSN